MVGSVDKSYGINVAKLANLPQEVINRSYELLDLYESNDKKKEKRVKQLELNFDGEKVDELRGIWQSSSDFPLYDKLTFDGDFMCIQKDNCDTYININYISAIVVKKYSQEEE